MQEKIKELLSVPVEEGIKEIYPNLLKDLYQMPVLWTVLHKDYVNIGCACGRPVVTRDIQGGGVSRVRLFTDYQIAVDFCAKNPEYSYKGVPLIAKLEKSKNDFNVFFHVAANMKVDRVWLDDCPPAQPLNLSLRDIIGVNGINTAISTLIKDGDMPLQNLQFNNEWIDLFSREMIKTFIDPVIYAYFSPEKDNVINYLKNRAPFIYVLFTCVWFEDMLNNENWRKANPNEIEEGEGFSKLLRKTLVQRVNSDGEKSDTPIMWTLGENGQIFTLEDKVLGLAVSDFYVKKYAELISKNRQVQQVNAYSVAKFEEVLDFCKKSGLKSVRFFIPYNERISISIDIDKIMEYLREE